MSKKSNPFAKDPRRRCPRCGQEGDMYQRDVMNKLSRTDNETFICGPCGTAEAFGGYDAPWATRINPAIERIAKQRQAAKAVPRARKSR